MEILIVDFVVFGGVCCLTRVVLPPFEGRTSTAQLCSPVPSMFECRLQLRQATLGSPALSLTKHLRMQKNARQQAVPDWDSLYGSCSGSRPVCSSLPHHHLLAARFCLALLSHSSIVTCITKQQARPALQSTLVLYAAHDWSDKMPD